MSEFQYHDGFPRVQPSDAWFGLVVKHATCSVCGGMFDFEEEGEGHEDKLYCQACAESYFIRCDSCEHDYRMEDYDFNEGCCKNCEYMWNQGPIYESLKNILDMEAMAEWETIYVR